MVIPVIPFFLGWKTTNFLIASEPLGQNQHQIWFEKNKQLVTEVEPPNKSLAHQSIVESSIGVRSGDQAAQRQMPHLAVEHAGNAGFPKTKINA